MTDSPRSDDALPHTFPPLIPLEFRGTVLRILREYEGRYTEALEVYLRSLWNLVQQAADENPSYSLFARLIGDSFRTAPAEFQYQWLKYDEEPDWLRDDHRYLIRSWKDFGAVIATRDVSDFEVLKRTLLFQIADLNRMPDSTHRDPLRYFGKDSPIGSTWFNFDVFTYWECATAGFTAKLEVPMHQHHFEHCDWTNLAFLLALGRSYE